MTGQLVMEDASFDHNWPPEWVHANMEAYLALSGARVDVAGILETLLRSDAPLHPSLRSALADALAGNRPTGCPTLAVVGTGRGHETPSGLARFQRDVAVAELVQNMIKSGSKREAAEREIASRYGIGEDLCHKAVTGFRKMEKWLAALPPIAPPGGMPADDWERLQRPLYLFNVGPLTR